MTVTTNLNAVTGAQIIQVVGEIDIATSPALRRTLDEARLTSSAPVVVDLSRVTFMDCSALDALTAAREQLGDRLSLRGIPHRVAWLLGIAGLDGAFLVAPANAPTNATGSTWTGSDDPRVVEPAARPLSDPSARTAPPTHGVREP